jgi:Protein of unknown function (DUF4242)
LPTFLDIRSIGALTEEDPIKEQRASRDQLGVKTVKILYNFEVGTIYCLIDAPTKEAVETHHDKIGVKCDWIMEVKTTQKT